jgi:hypothetical protein
LFLLGLFYILWCLAIFFHFEWGWLVQYQGNLSITEFLVLLIVPLFLATFDYRTVLATYTSKDSTTDDQSHKERKLNYFSQLLFLILIVVQLIDVYILLPTCPNHWQLVGIINISYLINFLIARSSKSNFDDNFRHSVIAITVAFYSFATFWKFTVAFFNPIESCGIKFTEEIPLFGSLLPDTILFWLPLLTVIIEATIPLLITLQLYKLALISGLLFHFGLALNIKRFFVNFSAVMYSLLIICCNQEPLWEPTVERALRVKLKLLALTIILIVLIVTCSSTPNQTYRLLRFIFFGIVVTYLIILAVSKWEFKEPQSAKINQEPIYLRYINQIPLTLLIINGLLPIFGIRNGSAWQMYGNLVLTEETSNHFLLPPSLNVLNRQGHKVKVRFTNGQDITTEKMTLLQSISNHSHTNTILQVSNLNNDPISLEELKQEAKQLKWFERKIIRLRTREEMQGCSW